MANAQAIYGTITGTVVDPSGAAVVNATVTVTDVAKGTAKVVKTNETGAYIVHNLIPDAYVVKVEAPGFQKAVSDQITVNADSSPLLNIKLTVGSSTQTVEVTTAAPELKTDRADVATELDSLAIVETPNIGHNITNLVLLAPGTTASTFTNAAPEDPQRSTPIAANGQSPFSAGFILDGANDKDAFIGEVVVNPPLDSIAEVKFINQNYDAEFGSAVAGITVMQTKSGSNKFHGTLYDFRHSDAQQARDPFTQFPGVNSSTHGPDIPHTLSNIYGGTIGGPIFKNKLFFFGDYQGTRQKLGNSFFMTVPTALVHSTCTGSGAAACDLHEYLNGGQNQVYDPAQGTLNADGANTGVGRTAFVNNQIPNNRLSAAAINLLKIIPGPNVTGAGITNNFLASGNGVFNFNQFDVRIDDQLKQNLHLFGRFGYLGSTQSSPASLGQAGGNGFGPGGWAGTETGGNYSAAVGADLVVNPKLFTDFRFSYMRYAFVEAKYDGTTPLMTSLGWLGLNTAAPGSGGAAEINPDGLATMGAGNHGAGHCNCPLDMTEQEYSFVNNWTKDMGRHSIRLGGELRLLHQVRIPSDNSRSGELAFQQARTSLGVLDPVKQTLSTSAGLGLASLLFGDVSTMSRFFSPSSTNPSAESQPRIFVYVQDNWKATNKLTITIGGRWENYIPEHVNGKDQGGFYNWETDMIEVAGEGPFNNSLNIKNNWALLAPRFGFAYQLTPKSVLRGGLGRAFDPGFYGDVFSAVLSQTIPVLQNQSFSQKDGLGTDAARNGNGSIYNVAVAPDAPTSAFVIPASGQFILPINQAPSARPLKERLPDVFGWNLSYQQQITPATAVTVSYVANKTTHGMAGSTWGGINWNDPSLQGFALNLPCQGALFYSKFGALPYNVANGNQCGQGWMTYYDHQANAHYGSIQAVVEHRLSAGLQFQASYVLSTATGVGTQGYFIQDNHANWGRFDFNRKHDFKLNGTYFLPFGKGKQFGANMNTLADDVFGGFSINANINWASGLPYSASYSECRADAPDWDMPCRPTQISNFAQSAGKFDPVAHTVRYFTPVPAMTAQGGSYGAFQRPGALSFGTMQYGSLTGPGLFTADATVKKSIPVHDEIKMDFEIQMQNLFNHANLSSPNSCVDCTVGSGAGLITDIQGGTFAGMRQVQFAAHISF
jgi:hypothetical protein